MDGKPEKSHGLERRSGGKLSGFSTALEAPKARSSWRGRTLSQPMSGRLAGRSAAETEG